jgi:tetratricopeptide (TPR) repeat protein
LLGLVLLVTSLGAITLASPPVLDDKNEWDYIASWSESGRIPALDCFGYFRPIKNLLFALCAPAADGTILAAHVVSLAAYALVTLLVFVAARRLLGNERWALAVTALQALAPTQLSAIAWFSCTTNVVLNIVLVLAALLTAESACARWQARQAARALGYGALALLGAALALLSYEAAVSLPALFLLWQYARRRSWLERSSLCVAFLLGLTVAGYLLLRAHFQGITSSATTGFFPPLRAVEVTFASAYFTLHHLGLWLWPWGRLTLFTGYPPAGTLAPSLFPACWLVLLASTGLAFRLRSEIRFLWIGWLWFLLAFLPMSNLIPFRNGPFADYYLVLPGFGLALALAGLLHYCAGRWSESTGTGRQLGAIVGVALLLVRGGITFELPRGLYAWRQTHTLNRYLLQADPHNYVVLANMGGSFIQARQLDTAEQLVSSAQQMAPWYDYACQLRGQIELARTNYPAARRYFAQAHQLNSGEAYPLKALGFIHEQAGQLPEALEFYQQALARSWDGDSAKLAVHVAEQLCSLGRNEEADALFERAQHYAPHQRAVVLYRSRLQNTKDVAPSQAVKPAGMR